MSGEGGGCTQCGSKQACTGRKGHMFAAIDEALRQLYPTRVWGQRRESEALEPASELTEVAAERVTTRLGTAVTVLPGGVEEYCDYVYVLCVGREPGVLAWRNRDPGGIEPSIAGLEPEAGAQDVYLRLALSALGPFAAVQQSTLELVGQEGLWFVHETTRSGVFDPVLLPRFRRLVAVLSELGLQHLDFGEITTLPEGFDPGDYATLYGGEPATANFLFYPQPCASVTTTLVGASAGGALPDRRGFLGRSPASNG